MAADRRNYRKVYVRIWNSPEFRALSDAHKILALYLLTGPQTNRVGFFKVSLALAGEDLHKSAKDIASGILAVCRAFDWCYDARLNILLIPTWWEYNPVTENPKNLKGYLTDLNDLPRTALIGQFCQQLTHIPPTLHHLIEKWRASLMPSKQDTLGSVIEHRSNTDRTPILETEAPIPTDTDTQTQTETSTETETRMTRTDGASAFDRFWTHYPKKVGKDEAKKAWAKRQPDVEVVLSALIRQNSWLLRDGGQFVPNPATWLNQGRWQDEPPDLTLPSAPTNKRIAGLIKGGEAFLKMGDA